GPRGAAGASCRRARLSRALDKAGSGDRGGAYPGPAIPDQAQYHDVPVFSRRLAFPQDLPCRDTAALRGPILRRRRALGLRRCLATRLFVTPELWPHSPRDARHHSRRIPPSVPLPCCTRPVSCPVGVALSEDLGWLPSLARVEPWRARLVTRIVSRAL